MTTWSYKYIPKTLEECILPANHRRAFEKFIADRSIPNLLLVGEPGLGKTTAANVLKECCDYDFFDFSSATEYSPKRLREECVSYVANHSLFGKKKALIFNEADCIAKNSQSALLGVIDEYSKYCTFVFTANVEAKFIKPMLSRTHPFRFSPADFKSPEMINEIVNRIRFICKMENRTFKEDVVRDVIKRSTLDIRSILDDCDCELI